MSESETDLPVPIELARSNKTTALAQAYYSLTKTEKKVMEAAIFKLENGGRRAVVDARFYADVYEVDRSNAYKELRNGGKGLVRKVFKIKNDDESLKEVTLLASQEYMKKEGKLIVQFNELAMPFVLSIKGEDGTGVTLRETSQFSSFYTHRLNELIESWLSHMNLDEIEHEACIDELRALLAVPKSYVYSQVKSLVNNGVVEINEYTSMNVSVKEAKRQGGKKVTHLIFKVKRFYTIANDDGRVIDGVLADKRRKSKVKAAAPEDLENRFADDNFTDQMFSDLVSHRLTQGINDSQPAIDSVIKELIKASVMASVSLDDVLSKYYTSGWKRVEAEWFIPKLQGTQQSISFDNSGVNQAESKVPGQEGHKKPNKVASPPPEDMSEFSSPIDMLKKAKDSKG